MTIAAFDPRLINKYEDTKFLLHFQWNNESSKIYRYALVEEINVSDIDHGSKCKKDEIGLTQQEIWEKKYNGKSKV